MGKHDAAGHSTVDLYQQIDRCRAEFVGECVALLAMMDLEKSLPERIKVQAAHARDKYETLGKLTDDYLRQPLFPR